MRIRRYNRLIRLLLPASSSGQLLPFDLPYLLLPVPFLPPGYSGVPAEAEQSAAGYPAEGRSI